MKKGNYGIRKTISITKIILISAVVIAVAVAGFKLYGYFFTDAVSTSELAELEYEGCISVEVNNNSPQFTAEDKLRARREVFEEYSELDSRGRCGVAYANLCRELMPEGERESLSSVTPSGWQRINFWTRSHLIGYQLAGEQANAKNLITGTYRMNAVGMLEYENKVASYIRMGKDRHVLYRVTPVYAGKNLVASGVQMEALSVDDGGEAICFNVYVFNFQPGYVINYSDGTVEPDSRYVTKIRLKDRKAQYTGKAVHIGDAEVEGSNGEVGYIYYVDKSAKTKTSVADGADGDGSAPRKRGVYYVRAYVTGDSWYPDAVSEPAKLTIK